MGTETPRETGGRNPEVKKAVVKMKGRELARKYWEEVAYPALLRPFAAPLARTAVGLFGPGSDVRGWDDEQSVDGKLGPRLDFILMPEDFKVWSDHLQQALDHLPTWIGDQNYRYDLRFSTPGDERNCRALDLDEYFVRMTGVERAPINRRQWQPLAEDKLFEVTNDFLIQDPVGEYTQRVVEFREYFPESEWMRRITRTCRELMDLDHSEGRIGALGKAVARGDMAQSHRLLGQGLAVSMRLAFLLDKKYAPENKWLFRALELLPRLGVRTRELIESAAGAGTWEQRESGLQDTFWFLKETLAGDKLAELGPDKHFLIFAETLNKKYQRLAMGD